MMSMKAAPRLPQSPGALSVFGGTATSGFSLRKLFSPMPFTFIRSSIRLKLPLLVRYSRIRSAVLRPMPGSVSSCSSVAVLRLIGGLRRRCRRDGCGRLRGGECRLRDEYRDADREHGGKADAHDVLHGCWEVLRANHPFGSLAVRKQTVRKFARSRARVEQDHRRGTTIAATRSPRGVCTAGTGGRLVRVTEGNGNPGCAGANGSRGTGRESDPRPSNSSCAPATGVLRLRLRASAGQVRLQCWLERIIHATSPLPSSACSPFCCRRQRCQARSPFPRPNPASARSIGSATKPQIEQAARRRQDRRRWRTCRSA